MLDLTKPNALATTTSTSTTTVPSTTTPAATTPKATVPTPTAAKTGMAALTAPTDAATLPTPKTNGLVQGAKAATTPLNDSVADKVNELISQDSRLMQLARTDGLKAANRRGLLNSSLAVGASQDAMVRQALPIASQDAAQAHQKNIQATDLEWRSGESALDREMQESLAKAQRELELKMQQIGIDAQDRQQIRDIASREGLAAAERALEERMQQVEIGARNDLAHHERLNQQLMQDREIGYQTDQRERDRILQERLAGMNLASADRNAAAQFITNMETLYTDTVRSIMGNTNLDAATREQQLASAKNHRDKQLSFVEQMYVIDLKWTDADFAQSAAKAAAAPRPPIAGFNEAAYLAANPDVAAAVRSGAYSSAQAHYEERGRMEGRAASGNGLNADAYLAANPDVAAAIRAGTVKSAQEHYDTYGRAEGRATSAPAAAPKPAPAPAPAPKPAAPKAFNEEAYLRANPDVAAAVRAGQISASAHYQQYGKNEGRGW